MDGESFDHTICPHCDEQMNYSLDDGGGDYGDGITEFWRCPICGYELYHDIGSPSFHDIDGTLFWQDDYDQNSHIT